MKTHALIDQRSLALARIIVAKIDEDPNRTGLVQARERCRRWYEEREAPAHREWLEILDRPWRQVRDMLLDESESGQRLRQSTPFCGVLTPRERWAIYKDWSERAA